MKIKPNMDMIPDWLEGWLSNPGSPADWLRLAWFNGEPLPGSEWTRDAELNRWIANSESDPVAWEGCRRLLERTGSPDRPIPVALIQWARDVAIETIKKPKLRQGQHSTDNGWRDLRIAQAVWALRGAGMKLEEACYEVAGAMKRTNARTAIEEDAVLKVYKSVRKRDRYFGIFSVPSF